MEREWEKDIDEIQIRTEKKQALKIMSEFVKYLKSHNIYCEEYPKDDIPHVTMAFKNCDSCPGHITEGSTYFYEDCMEARVYYSEIGTKWCKESKNLSELYRLEHLITHRFCVTEDGCHDITTIMAFPYSYFELDSLRIEDFITAALPDLLDSLSAPIFLLLLGEINIEKAIRLVDTEILGEGGKE